MAFEVFDDVAFFYLALSVVAMAVLPWTLLKVGFGVYESLQKPHLIPLTRIQKLKLEQQKAAGTTAPTQDTTSATTPSTIDPAAVSKSSAAASGLTQENLRPPKPWLTCGNISLALLWVLFFYMLLQIPTVSDQSLASFKPYEILGIEPTATEKEIKKAYLKQSLLYHPDRNPSPEAAQQFILISKAHDTLTDPTAKENIEKYGNPDGYQGVSVTIGLPSILTKKENEMRVLVVYFFIFIVLPPVIVWAWWRRAKEFVDGGLMKKTLGLWFQFMLPNMGSKFLIEFLSIAAENEVLLGPEYPTDVAAFKKLATEVKPQMVKQRFQDASKFGAYFQYSHKASVLLHAYLLRLPTPASMTRDIAFLLKDAHRFLNTLVELALAKGFVRTVFGLFDLMQLVTQGLFAHDSPLMQLPHISQEDVRRLARKNVKTVHQVLKAPHERLAKILPDLTEAQWAAVRSTGELIPDVELRHAYSVEDEEGLYEGDLVTLKVNLERVSFDPDKPESDAPTAYRMSHFDGDESTTVPSAEESQPKETVPAAKKAPAAAAPKTDAVENKEDGAAASPESSSDSDDDLPTMTDDEILDSMPLPKAGKSIADIRASGPSVHSLTFPHPKHEKWFVLLVEKSNKKSDRIVGLVKVDSFFDDAEVEIKFLAPRARSAKEDGLRAGDEGASVWEYEIHAICDSYVGVDQVRTFTMKVEKPRGTGEEVAKRAAEKVSEEYAELAADEEYIEEDGPWYYLYFPTFWELALNVAVLALLCVFIFNFLMSRGYWQKYVWPLTNFIGHYTNPIVDAVMPYLAPILDPMRGTFDTVYQTISDALHRDPFPIHPDDVHIDESAIPGMGQED